MQWIGVAVGFVFPTLLGWAVTGGWVGALGGFLFGGVARVVVRAALHVLHQLGLPLLRQPAVLGALQRAG